jgi:hypothetical protein
MEKHPTASLESFRVAAKRFKRDPSRLRQLRIEGKLPEAIKIGRDWYLPKGSKLPA